MKRKQLILESDWVSWFDAQIKKSTTNPFMLAMPLRGVVYKIDRSNKTASVEIEYHKYRGSDTELINNRILEHLGYTVDSLPGCTKNNPIDFIAALDESVEKAGGKLVVDPKLLRGVGELFDVVVIDADRAKAALNIEKDRRRTAIYEAILRICGVMP